MTSSVRILNNPQADVMREIIHGQMTAMIDNHTSMLTINRFVQRALGEITDDISVQDFMFRVEMIKKELGMTKKGKL